MSGINPARQKPEQEADHQESDLWTYKIVLGVWFLLAIVSGGKTFLNPDSHTVFPILAGSAERFWSDKPLYGNYPPLDYFRYSPSFAVAITPFYLAGPVLGGILWIWLGLALFGFGLFRFLRDCLPSKTWSRYQKLGYFLIALMVAFPGIINGQSNTLVIGLILIGISASEKNEWWLAGMVWATAVAVKLTPMVVIGIPVLFNWRKLALPLAVSLIAIGLIPFLFASPSSACRHYQEWFYQIHQTSTMRWPGFRDAWTLHQVFSHLMMPGSGEINLKAPIDTPVYRIIQVLMGILVLVLCWINIRFVSNPGNQRVLLFGIPMAYLMLFGPAVEHAGFALVAPFIAWSLVDNQIGIPAKIMFYLAGLLILLIQPFSAGLPRLATLPLGSLFFLIGLIVFLFQLVFISKYNTSPASSRLASNGQQS